MRLAGRLGDTGLASADVSALLALRGAPDTGGAQDGPPRVDMVAGLEGALRRRLRATGSLRYVEIEQIDVQREAALECSA